MAAIGFIGLAGFAVLALLAVMDERKAVCVQSRS